MKTTLSLLSSSSRNITWSQHLVNMVAAIISCIVILTIGCEAEQQQYHHHLRSLSQTKDDDHSVSNGRQFQTNDSDDAKNELTAVIHIGPMKTGSSAIQASFGKVLAMEDNYQDAGFAMDDGIEAYHMIGCFRPDAVPYTGGPEFEISCHPNALNQVSKVATEQNKNLIITAEYLTDPQTNLIQFKEFLTPLWKHIKVVAVYRRFYEWLISFHNQFTKVENPASRKTIVDFLTKESKWHFSYKHLYFVDAIQRYKDVNFTTNIQIINTYDIPNHDIREAFFCNGLPNALASCKKFHELQQEEKMEEESTKKKKLENKSVPLVYTDLAYYAERRGLWSSKTSVGTDGRLLTMEIVAAKAQHFQENIFEKTQYDFDNIHENAIICPDQSVLNYLLDTTLETEREYFPEYYYNQGIVEIMNDFDEMKNNHKFCHIDAKIVVEHSDVWQEFFHSLHNENNNQAII